MTRRQTRSIALSLALSIGLPMALMAQEVKPSRLDRLEAELTRLDARAQAASGEERDLYFDLLRRTSREFDEAMGSLFTEFEEVSGDQRADLGRRLEEHNDRLTRLVEDQSVVVAELRRELSGASPARAVEIESSLTTTNDELDRLLESQLTNLERLEALGKDVDYAPLDVRLERRAELTAARIAQALDGIAEAERRVAKTTGGAEVAAATTLAALQEKLRGTTKTLGAMATLLERRGSSGAAEYRELVIEATGRLSIRSLDRDVALTAMERGLRGLQTRVQERWTTWAFFGMAFLLILAISWVLARLARRLVHRIFTSSQVRHSRLLEGFVTGMVSKLVLFLGLVVALSQVGVEVAPFVAGLGVAGLVLGLALQDTLSNFFSGLMILLFSPYDVDDVVDAAGVTGTVHAMNLVSTTILTFDNKKLIVPNKKIWSDTIQNVTAQDLRRVDLEVGVSYGDSVEHVERVLHDVVTAHAMVVDEPPLNIRLHRLDDSSVTFIVRPWVKREDYWTAYWELLRGIKLRFDEEGITIPFPQRDVHVHGTGDGDNSAPSGES